LIVKKESLLLLMTLPLSTIVPQIYQIAILERRNV